MKKNLLSFSYDSKKSGPHLLVLGAIHGNEICGTVALSRLKTELDAGIVKLNYGKLSFLPLCNPLAYQKGIRFIDKNLNRIIAPHAEVSVPEQAFANQVVRHIDQCDYLLDLHSYASGKKPFIFLDYDTPEIKAFATAQGVRNCVTGWPELYEGETAGLNEGDTLSYANKVGKIGTLVECGTHTDPAAAIVAYQSIRRSLSFLGITEEGPATDPDFKMSFCRAKKIFTHDKEGAFTKPWNHLDRIKKDQPLATFTDGSAILAPFSGRILLPNAESQIGHEWFYVGQPETPKKTKKAASPEL